MATHSPSTRAAGQDMTLLSNYSTNRIYSMDRLKNRGSEMLSYFSKSAQLLSVKVRIETQVCFDYKLFHGVDSVCAII